MSARCWGCVTVLCALVVGPDGAAAGASCGDAASCQDRLKTVVDRLESTQESMITRRQTMQALEGLRSSLMLGKRVSLPSEQRQHLEKGSPLVAEVSYDSKQRPLSTNVSKHMRHIRTIDSGSDIRLHGLLPVKRPSTAEGKSGGGNTILVATLAGESKFSLHTPDGEQRLRDFELGHHVTHMSLSTHPDYNYVLTGDASGELRAHLMELVARGNSSSGSKSSASDKEGDSKKQLTVVANTTAKFSLPHEEGDGRTITSVLVVDRSSNPYFLVGDSLGSVAVFFKNGTLKGRIKVTEDPGGIRGLLRGQSQTVLFYSSHSFGFLNVANVEVPTTPCGGWSSPLFDIAPDPLSSYSRVVLALSDGDVLVFSTVSGKNKDKTCDLTMKFPRISTLPFRLHVVRGHIMGLPTPLESTKQPDAYNRELFFFNIGAMEQGHGAAQSSVVTLQAAFDPRRLHDFSIVTSSGGGSAAGSGPKVHLGLTFAKERGVVELYELTMKTPVAPAAAKGGSGAGATMFAWLDWFPKVGIFGITLVGVVIWNVRKVSSKQSAAQSSGLSDGDDDFLRERLAGKKDGAGKLGASSEKLDQMLSKAKLGAAAKKAGGASGSASMDADLRELSESTREMAEALSSMNVDDED